MDTNYLGKKMFKVKTNRYFMHFVRITAITGIAIGCVAVLIPLAVLGGFRNELRSKAITFASHVTVKTFNRAPVPDVDSVTAKIIESVPELDYISPVVSEGAILKQKRNTDGIMVCGVVDSLAAKHISEYMTQGEFKFSKPDTNEIIISESLARRFELELGDKAVVFSGSPEDLRSFELPNIEPFRVTGIYSTGMGQYDDVVCFLPIDYARKFFGAGPKEATNIDIFLNDAEKAPEVALRLDDVLGYPYYTLSVFDTHGAIFNWIELQRKPIPIVLGLIGIVAVFNIISVLLILVIDKTKSVGTLRAVGLERKYIRRLFLREGMLIAGKGLLIGCGLALGACLLQKNTGFISLDPEIYFLDKVPVDIKAFHYSLVVGGTFLMSAAAAYIPAYVAARISPINAIRFK